MAPTQATAQAPDQGADLIAAPLIVLGGGEHARVVIEAARTRPDRWVVQGYVGPDEAGGPGDLPWLGEDATLAARLADLAPGDRPWLVLGFGGGEAPGTLASRVAAADRFGGETRWATIVHATAWVAPSATVEAGAVVLASAVVNTGAHVGGHAIVNSAAVVEHDVVIGRGVHVAPGAVIGGGTHVGEGALIGLGARVRDHIEIGAGAIVGMGAVVVGSIAPGARVVGVPARSHDPHRTEPAT
jgi:acetyltransferase EpsM